MSSTDVGYFLQRIDDKRMVIHNATFTTCKPGNDDWFAKVGELNLDFTREVGQVSNAKLYFQGVPFVWVPWMSFALNNQLTAVNLRTRRMTAAVLLIKGTGGTFRAAGLVAY